MLNQIAKNVLEKLLGDYIEGDISMSGDLKFQNLTIRKDIFDKLDLPVRILKGVVGKLNFIGILFAFVCVFSYLFLFNYY